MLPTKNWTWNKYLIEKFTCSFHMMIFSQLSKFKKSDQLWNAPTSKKKSWVRCVFLSWVTAYCATLYLVVIVVYYLFKGRVPGSFRNIYHMFSQLIPGFHLHLGKVVSYQTVDGFQQRRRGVLAIWRSEGKLLKVYTPI